MPQGHPIMPIKCRLCSYEKKAPNSKCPNNECIMSKPGRHNTTKKLNNYIKIKKSIVKKSKKIKLKPKKLDMIDLPIINNEEMSYKIENHEVPFNIELNDTKVRLAIKKKNIKSKYKKTKKIIIEEVIKKQNILESELNRLEIMISSYIYSSDNTINTNRIYNKLDIIKNKLKKSEDIICNYC
tara:strand:+ start:2397 stop:2945 length:549 start_codon:yes stop_codon:yes gene_type:complete